MLDLAHAHESKNVKGTLSITRTRLWLVSYVNMILVIPPYVAGILLTFLDREVELRSPLFFSYCFETSSTTGARASHSASAILSASHMGRMSVMSHW